MNFKDYIELHRDEVYRKICEYIPIKEPEGHYRIVRDYSDRQGSYRRPGLLMLSGQLFGAREDELVLPAAAMQLSEDWILVHDDIEDHSELRRGKPALHKLYGQELAINAGDAAHMVMWKMLKDNIRKMGMRRGSAFFDNFYRMLEYTVEGQYIEDNFIYNVRSLAAADEKLYFRIIQGKTCYYTVYGPMQLGAIAAGMGKSELGMLKEIGMPAGMAFQIVDDILDMRADEKVFGKQRYGDLREGKLTLIMLDAYKSADAEEKKEMQRIYGKRREEKSEEEIMYLAGIAEKYGSIEKARKKAEWYGAAAKQAIEKYSDQLPKNEFLDVMLTAIEELYVRKK
jgi:geranylgeranyl diphosphate synthase type II